MNSLRNESTHVTLHNLTSGGGGEVVELIEGFNSRMSDFVLVGVSGDSCGLRVGWDLNEEFLDIKFPRGASEIRVLVDSMVIEMFVNNGLSTKSFFKNTTNTDAFHLGLLFGDEEGCSFESIDVWEMKPFGFTYDDSTE